MGSRWPRALGVAVLLLVVATVGCSDDDGIGPGEKPRVVVVGDSITLLAQSELRSQLEGSGVDLVIEATYGATSKAMAVRATTVADQPAGQVIVNVGTNDVFQQVDPAQTLEWVTEILDLFADAECVHLVNLNEAMFSLTDDRLRPRIAEVNEGLEELDEERDRVSVVDWSTVASDSYGEDDESDLIDEDTIHPTKEGQRRLAEMYVDALESC